MNSVKIQWLGHSCFRMEYAGWSLVIDPYADGSVNGLCDIRQNADAVYCSHDHFDHAAVENVKLSGREAPADFTAETIDVPHDHHGGEKRGMNKIHLFTFGTLRVVHMGDTGSIPGEEILAKLRGCDLILIPIGGFFTIDAAEAAAIVRSAAPRVVVPMHYRTAEFGFDVLADPDAFLAACGGPVIKSEDSSFELTDETPAGIVLLRPALLG